MKTIQDVLDFFNAIPNCRVEVITEAGKSTYNEDIDVLQGVSIHFESGYTDNYILFEFNQKGELVGNGIEG